jgi:hypothetical protein
MPAYGTGHVMATRHPLATARGFRDTAHEAGVSPEASGGSRGLLGNERMRIEYGPNEV